VPNSGGSTYHPKLYLGRKAGQLEAVIGSANLTGGLWTNVEAAVSLRGHASDVPLHRALEVGRRLVGGPADVRLGSAVRPSSRRSHRAGALRSTSG
jgi:hypothetical protein